MKSDSLRHVVFAVAQFMLAAVATASPDKADNSPMAAEQEARNDRAGPRHAPAKNLPVPAELTPEVAAAVAQPYGSPLWNLNAPNAAAWHEIVAKSVAVDAPKLAAARAALGVSLTPTTVGGIPAFWLEPNVVPPNHRGQVIVNIHGGGWVFGPGESGTTEAMLLAAHGGYRVLAIDYRMPPDSPFPAALDDLVAAWRELVKTTDPRHIGVEGTSAGGNLTLAMMLRLKAEGLPMPAAIAPGSPVSDLTKTGDSYATNEWVDNVLVTYDGFLSRGIDLYAHGHDLRNPLISPIHGDFSGLPPAIFTTGTRDLLLSDTIRAHRKMRQAGVPAELNVFEGLSHAQFSLTPDAPDAKEAYGEIASFFDRYLSR